MSLATAIEHQMKQTNQNNITHNLSNPTKIACDLFQQFVWIELTTQNRSIDHQHTKVFMKLYNNEKLTMDDLKLYKMLSIDDITGSDKDKWQFATIICHTNDERKAFEYHQAKRFAITHDKPIIRWEGSNEFLSKNIGVLDSNDHSHYQYFVPDALSILLNNLNTNNNLSNGTKIKLHSLTFASLEDQNYFVQMFNKRNATTDVITLQNRPYSVNVQLFPNEPNDNDETLQHKQIQRQNWKHGSLVKNEAIIPLLCKTKHQASSCTIHSKLQNSEDYAKLLHTPVFPFYMSSSITSYKGQSQTLGYVIIVLPSQFTNASELKFITLNEINVDFTRVLTADHIRLLVLDKSSNDDPYKCLDYITKLKFPAAIINLINSFESTSSNLMIRKFNRNKYESLIHSQHPRDT
jgi:hypothetical protein